MAAPDVGQNGGWAGAWPRRSEVRSGRTPAVWGEGGTCGVRLVAPLGSSCFVRASAGLTIAYENMRDSPLPWGEGWLRLLLFDTIRYDSDTIRYDTMARETIRCDADTIWIRYGSDATRYDIRFTVTDTVRIRCDTIRYTGS